MIGNPRRWAIALALAIPCGCAPPVDGPAAVAAARDRDDADRLARQLALLPGVLGAQVVVHHAVADPLAPGPPAPAIVSAVVAIDDGGAPAPIRATGERLARALVPELAAPTIEVVVAAPRPELARVGPFTVEARARDPLRATLAIGCAAIAALAVALARRQRRGTSAQ